MQLINWNEHLFRCSALGSITAISRGSTITENQLAELNKLLEKVELTERQAIRRDELVAKRDAPPQLSEGAKSYLKQLWKEKTFGRYKHVDTKYMRKGTEEEHTALIIADEVLGWGIGREYIEGQEFHKIGS